MCSEIVQPVTKYFEAFIPFLLCSPSHKWNWTSLSSKTECISCFTSCWTILKDTEISENLKVACRQSLVPNLLSRNKYLAIVLENWKKIPIKSSIDKAYFTHQSLSLYQSLSLQLYQKRDSGTGVFLGILWNH